MASTRQRRDVIQVADAKRLEEATAFEKEALRIQVQDKEHIIQLLEMQVKK
ncbi:MULTISPECIES: hypothetical protein [Hymenobacter]|uniref:hypothetical protein n=1 Tax=Hymenobacter TaxID=89966 RepID=UPI000B098678|nr:MULTISPECIES: hypothetical protein [Hymenobacter]